MSGLDDLDLLSKEHKLKKLRNKNSYMDAFLERRKQAADFALEKRNPSGYKYTKPNYYVNVNDGRIVTKSQKSGKKNTNSLEEKQEFYKTYNTLKKNLIGKNNSINNIILIEKENNKYYLSQGLPKTYEYINSNYNYNNSNYKTLNHNYLHNCCGYCKHRNKINCNYNYSGKSTQCQNDITDEFLTNEEITRKFNNIKHHSINTSKKNKKEQKSKEKNINNINNKTKNKNKNESQNEVKINTNTFGNNLKIEKTGINSYNKNKNKVSSSPNINSINNKEKDKGKDTFKINNELEYNINNNKYKYKSVQNTNTNTNVNTNISIIKAKEINKEKDKDKRNNSANNIDNIYYEGTDNHNFYDSNKMSNYKYSYEPYKIDGKNGEQKQQNYYSRNLSEPQLERNKNLYIVKAIKNKIDSGERINDISPIRTYARYDYEDNNEEMRNIEKIYESQSNDGNSLNNNINNDNNNNKFAYNVKLQNNFSNIKKNINLNFNLNDNNDKRNLIKSADLLNRPSPSAEVISNTPNTKTVSIVYKSEKNKRNKSNPIVNNIKVINEPNHLNFNFNLNKKEIVDIKNNKNKNKEKDNDIINIFNNNNLNSNKIYEIHFKDKDKDIYEKNYILNNNNDMSNEKENRFRKELKNIENKYLNNIKNANINTNTNKKENSNKKEVKYKSINNCNYNNNQNNKNNENANTNIRYTFNDKKKENKIEIENNIKKKEKESNINIDNQDINNKTEDKDKDKYSNINNNSINSDNNEDYQKLVDQEQNYESIKEKYESFLRQKDEKEPNLQSKIMNSMLISKDESNIANNKNNLIKNIKEKIQILKNNNKTIKKNSNYCNEIDDYFNKIKKKEEENNIALNEFYQTFQFQKKERKNTDTNNNINTIGNNNNININVITKESDNNNNNTKKVVIQKSNRLQKMMKNILYKKKYKNNLNNNLNNYNTMTLRNNFNKIKFSKYSNAPDINLIVDKNIEENIKIIDEDEYSKLKKRNKNIKSSRPINLMTKKLRDNNNNHRISSYRESFDFFGNYNKGNKGNDKYKFNFELNDKYQTFFSPKIILQDPSHKIMPANEII